MQRFYVDFPLGIDVDVIDGDIIHQLTRVMRYKEGNELFLFDGDGSQTLYRIEKIEKKMISLRGINREFPDTEPKKMISLYQAMPNKLEKLEFILQKGVEVGIRKFVFFRSDFSQKLLLTDGKKNRLLSIAREALEQCGGLILPEIVFLDLWPIVSEKEVIILDTVGKMTVGSELGSLEASVAFFVGPEGGWSKDERDFMAKNNFKFVHLGNRIMRTETAGVVTAFLLIHA